VKVGREGAEGAGGGLGKVGGGGHMAGALFFGVEIGRAWRLAAISGDNFSTSIMLAFAWNHTRAGTGMRKSRTRYEQSSNTSQVGQESMRSQV
jgi:hypothetical protein